MTILSRNGVKLCSAWLCLLLAFPIEVMAQQAQPAQPVPTQLNLVVVEGLGGINNVSQRVAREPIVQVEDENHKPIADAAVVFTLPTEGPTGEFVNGSKTFTIMTDKSGRAVARGLRFNQFPGKVPLRVSASYKGLSAHTIIDMETVLPPGAKPPSANSSSGGGHGKLIAILAVLGAAAAGGAYFATHKSGSSAPSTPTTPTGPTPIGITPGTGTIVGGH